MKIFKSSDLTHSRGVVMKAARDGGVIIQERRTNGEVIQEYILVKNCCLMCMGSGVIDLGYHMHDCPKCNPTIKDDELNKGEGE